MNAVMYGAGNIGRGFIGQLLYESGYNVCFVDIDPDLIMRLNKERRYPVRVLKDDEVSECFVENVSAVNGYDENAVSEKIANADIMATAVGVNILKYIAKTIALGIEKRYCVNKKPLDIIICENMIGADKYFRDLVGQELPLNIKSWFIKNIGFVEASIGRMVPVQTKEMTGDIPLRICVEAYNILPVDKKAFKGGIPKIKNLAPFSPFSFYIERKLYIHNMGHSLCAYLGDCFNDEYIWQAVDRPFIYSAAKNAMNESAAALAVLYSADLNELKTHVDDLLLRFSNRQLNDTVVRVGRDLRRKLSPDDRLVGAIRLCKKAGVPYDSICLAYAAALCFKKDDLTKNITAERIMTEVSGLSTDADEYRLILKEYKKLIKISS